MIGKAMASGMLVAMGEKPIPGFLPGMTPHDDLVSYATYNTTADAGLYMY